MNGFTLQPGFELNEHIQMMANSIEDIKMNSNVTDQHEEEPTQELLNDKDSTKVKLEKRTKKHLIYGLTDAIPLQVTIVSGLQHALLSLSNQLLVSLLVADAVCATNYYAFKAKLLSSTLFMNGITTIAMNLLGVRLPLFQGGSSEYIIPLLLIGNDDSTFCTSENFQSKNQEATTPPENMTSGNFTEPSMDLILHNVRSLQGSLMIAGLIHALLGFTGCIGILLKFIGPVTVVPCMLLISVFVVKALLSFIQVNWFIALSTAFVGIILSLYLANYTLPIPVWTPSRGFRIIWYPFHQVFAMLISILLNWGLCAIFTTAGIFTDDVEDIGYEARTDAHTGVITDSPWFNFPYPGQYGMVGFSGAAFIAFIIATLISVLDSIGDYYACARVCRVPAPPAHAVNRGILIEGLCSFLSGAVGCGHATSTNGGNLGAIGVLRVASISVFVCVGIFYILFGIIGKFCAVFITIPYPVLGGASIVMFSTFTGVALSNLQVLSISSSRNMTSIGFAVILGLAIPTYISQTSKPINTGNNSFDNIMVMLLGNPILAGTLIAFILDNTVPGTKEERGITAWQVPKNAEEKLDPELYDAGYNVYLPLLPRRLLEHRLMKYVPFLPYLRHEEIQT